MKALKFAALAALLAATTISAVADQTNLVENIRVRLVGLKQGGTRTVGPVVVTSVDTITVETRNVIRALGEATGNTFSSRSRLVLVTPQDGGAATVEVRDGDSKLDVTSFFALEQTGSAVTSSTVNTKTGRSTRIAYSIKRFALQDVEGYGPLNLRFDVSGFSADASSNHAGPWRWEGMTIEVSGNGDRNGEPLVIQGSMSISGGTLEVVPDDGGGIVT